MAGGFFVTNRAKFIKILILAVVIFILGMLVYFPNYSKLKKLRKKNQKLLEGIVELKKEIKTYEAKNKKIEKGSFIYEKIARDKLGVAREGEIIVDIKE